MIEKRFLGIVPRCIAIIGRGEGGGRGRGPNVVSGEKYDPSSPSSSSSSHSSRSCARFDPSTERRARLKTCNERARTKITARNTRISADDGRTGENRWYDGNGNVYEGIVKSVSWRDNVWECKLIKRGRGKEDNINCEISREKYQGN